jgi:hypothetical protein
LSFGDPAAFSPVAGISGCALIAKAAAPDRSSLAPDLWTMVRICSGRAECDMVASYRPVGCRRPSWRLDVGGELIGRASIRYELNDFLTNFGGHIGYGVLGPHRGCGYATGILRQTLMIARAEGVAGCS